MGEHVTSLHDHSDPWADRRRARAVADALFPGRVYDELHPQSLKDVTGPPAGQVWLGVFGDVTVLAAQPEDLHLGPGENLGPDVGRPEAWQGAEGLSDEALLELADLLPVATWLYGFLLLPRDDEGRPLAHPLLVADDGLPVVPLPPPATLATLLAGLPATGGFGRRTVTEPDRVRVETAGGDTLDLHLRPDGTALLLGRNDDDTTTYFRGAADYFEEPETDLLAGAPPWWGEVLEQFHDGLRGPEVEARAEWVTFLHGWDGRRWTKAVGAPDGSQARWILDSLAQERPAAADPAPVAAAPTGRTGLLRSLFSRRNP
jgi:hypothetical protein